MVRAASQPQPAAVTARSNLHQIRGAAMQYDAERAPVISARLNLPHITHDNDPSRVSYLVGADGYLRQERVTEQIRQAEQGSAAASFLAVEQRPPRRDELEQHIVVAHIRGQHHQAEFLRLQEQHTVLKRAQLAVFLIPLKAA